MAERVYIFDTTLRDGEQSPGCSMTVPEKLSMAAQARRPGRRYPRSRLPHRLRRRLRSRRRRQPRVPLGTRGRARPLPTRWTSNAPPSRLKHAKRPRIHTFIATSDIHLKYKLKKSQQQVLDEAVAAVELARTLRRRRRVLRRRRHAHRLGLSRRRSRKAVVAAGARTVNLPDTVGYSVPDEYGALIGRMVERPRRQRHRQRPLPRRSGPGRRQLPRRRPGRRAPGRVHHQRHRRTRRQRCARRDRHGAQDPPRPLPYETNIVHRTPLPRQPAADLDHHLRAAAQQGHRRRERLRPRSRHPPGRFSQGTHHLRDHGPAQRRRPRKQAGARQTQRPPRPDEAMPKTWVSISPRAARHRIPALHHAGRSQERHEQRRNFPLAREVQEESKTARAPPRSPTNEPKNPNPTRRRYRRRSDQCGRRSPKAVAKKFGHTLELTEGLIGGVAIHKTGTPFPQDTLDNALAADATLMGAVGLPEFDNAPPDKRPEKGLARNPHSALGVFANLRPVRTYPP